MNLTKELLSFPEYQQWIFHLQLLARDNIYIVSASKGSRKKNETLFLVNETVPSVHRVVVVYQEMHRSKWKWGPGGGGLRNVDPGFDALQRVLI